MSGNYLRKTLSLVLILALVISSLGVSGWGIQMAYGDSVDAKKITSSEDFPSEINEGEVYELAADITLTSGQQIETLAGILDGKGHTITLADKPLANVVSGTIQNLGLKSGENALVLTGVSGSMAVTLTGTIQNSFSKVNISYDGYDDTGALVGKISGGCILNCYHAGVNATLGGGLVGNGASGGTIANSYYTNGMMGPVSYGGGNVTKDKAEKIDDISTIDAVTKLNTNITSTGYIWAQDIEGINGGTPYLKEHTGELPVDKNGLEAKVTEAEVLDEAKYTVESWASLETALTSAKEILSNEEATQTEINSAQSALESAISALIKKKQTTPISINDYSEDKIKHISTQTELDSISSSTDMYYILDNDITLNDFYMSLVDFDGVFDGNGHTITFTNNCYTGLFKNIGSNGVIQNVHFTGNLKEYGACGTEVKGAIINCYTETGGNGAGFAKRLNGGIISNCYSLSTGDAGAIIAQAEDANGNQYTGTLQNVYWEKELSQPVDLSKLTLNGEVKAMKASEMKTLDFVATLNANKGDNGTSWGQNSNGYPYFGENQEYTPEEEGSVDLPANKTPIAFTSERTSETVYIENQEITIDINSAVNLIAGEFTLPEYQLGSGERIEWSLENLTVADAATVGSEFPFLSVNKEGICVVKATLVKGDGSTEVLAATKVIIETKAIEAIKLYLANSTNEAGTEIVDGSAEINGSEYTTIIIKAKYSGEEEYKTVSAENFNIVFEDFEQAIKHSENSASFKFIKEGYANLTVTYKENKDITASAGIRGCYVPVEVVKPAISGEIVLHGRNGNSSSGTDFLPEYSSVIVNPTNASYADAFTITSSDESIAKYVVSMTHGYVPYKAGTVTFTASITEPGDERTVSGTSEVTYVYKNPLKKVSVRNSDISLQVGETTSAGLTFEGTLTDGHEITETGMIWTYSTDGIVSISRGSGFWKRDTEDPDNGSFFLSSEYTIKALSEGVVTVTGTPMDQTAGAKPITFTVSVSDGEQESVDVFDIISGGIGTATAYIENQIVEQDNKLTYGFEWYIVSMLRAGKDISDDVLNSYYEDIVKESKSWTINDKPTDIERVALALAAMGKDITNVDGVDIAELIYNNTTLSSGSNELAYALLALDATKFEIPANATWNRETIIDELLKFQAADGSFGLADNSGSDEVDMAAIVLQALRPYQDRDDVKTACDKAMTFIKNSITTDFDYGNSNATAQVLLAISLYDIDVTNSANGFGGSAFNLITGLESYRASTGEGYLYGNKINPMATIQVMQAYDAYRKAQKEDVLYWDFTTAGKKYEDSSNAGDSNGGNNNAGEATVYVTIASDGKIVSDKNGGYVAQAPVKVTDINEDGFITVDEALLATHETYYKGGASAGYSTFTGQYGLALDKLWGKGTDGVAAATGYWLNNNMCYGLTDEVGNGDYLTAFNYYDAAGWSDAYAYFDVNTASAEAGGTVTLTLKYMTGYDENWAPLFSGYEGATVSFIGSNNTDTVMKTDAEGKVKISFPSSAASGDYYVMAYVDNASIVPAVCKITVRTAQSGEEEAEEIRAYIKVSDPKGATFLKKTAYTLETGSTVYDLLRETGLDIEVRNSAYGVYIVGIEGLAEFDMGPGSGWMYSVNNDFPGYSASFYTLEDGDYVEWVYTRDLGDDVGGNRVEEEVVEEEVEEGIAAETVKPKEETKNGKTEASVDSSTMKDALAAAKEAAKKDDKTAEIKIEVKGNKTTTKVETTIPTSSIKDIAKEDKVQMKVATPIVQVTFDNEAMKTISEEAKSTKVQLNVESKTVENRPAVEVSVASGSNKISNFGKGTVTVVIPYELGKDEVASGIIVRYVDEEGNKTDMPTTYNEKTKKVSFTTNHFSTYVVDYDKTIEKNFTDVNVGDWFYESVMALASKGIINGRTENTYAPNENITRAEFVTILANLSGKTMPAATDKFTDVKADDWFAKYVTWAAEAGIVYGTSADKFSPNAKISRQDMAVMISRYADYMKKEISGTNAAVTFTDGAAIADYAKDAVGVMQKAGIINGIKATDGSYSFAPKNNATRAQAATMIHGLIKK